MSPNIRQLVTKPVIVLGNIYFKLLHEGKTKINPERVKKILIIMPGGIGDAVIDTTMLPYIKDKFKNSRIYCACSEWSADILRGNRFIDKLILIDNETFTSRNIFKWTGFIRKMRKERFDLAIVLNLFFMPVVSYLSGAKLRLGEEKDKEGFALNLKTHSVKDETKEEIFLRVLSPLNIQVRNIRPHIDISENEFSYADKILQKNKFIAIAPGGGKNPHTIMYEKRWPLENYKEIVRKVINELGFNVLLLGDKNDSGLTNLILSSLNGNEKKSIIDMAGKTSLMEAAALLKKCKLFVCNDSGLMHISYAVDTPTVSIFGPTDPRKIALSDRKHVYIWKHLDCAPCFGGKKYCKDFKCINSITVDEVFKAIKSQLKIK